jgi:hypothetical protein
MTTPSNILAAGVLGLAGWGIWRRSQRVGAEADALPMPGDLELISRSHVVKTVLANIDTGGRISNQSDLAAFFNVTGWGDGATVVPAGHENDVAVLAGASWLYTRLIEASSLNMMCLINDAEARSRKPLPIPSGEIGTGKSIFNLATTVPIKPASAGFSEWVATIEKYLHQAIPVPPAPPKTS